MKIKIIIQTIIWSLLLTSLIFLIKYQYQNQNQIQDGIFRNLISQNDTIKYFKYCKNNIDSSSSPISSS